MYQFHIAMTDQQRKKKNNLGTEDRQRKKNPLEEPDDIHDDWQEADEGSLFFQPRIFFFVFEFLET